MDLIKDYLQYKMFLLNFQHLFLLPPMYFDLQYKMFLLNELQQDKYLLVRIFTIQNVSIK